MIKQSLDNLLAACPDMKLTRLSIAVLLLGLAVINPAVADTGNDVIGDEAEARATARDRLLYREALFHHYTNDDLGTLTLLENQHMGSNHIANRFHNLNHILAIEAGSRYGMHVANKDIAEHLAFTVREKDVLQRARLYEGRVAYEAGRYTEALKKINESLDSLDRVGLDEAYYLIARCYIHQKRPSDAGRALGKVTEGTFWAAYGYYNLAVYYGENDPDVNRALISFRVAAAMTPNTEEGLELKDRIYLSAGHLALMAEQHDKALAFLQNVRADGASAAAGIYDYGLAFAGLKRYRVAIQAWHRAKKFALVVPGVAEAFQAIAYGYEQEGLRATSIDAYLEAVSVYDKEMRHTSEIRKSLLADGMLAVLDKARKQHNEAAWFLATDLVTNTPTVAFVNFLMSDDEFYDLAKTLLQLDDMRTFSRSALERLDIYEQALNKKAADVKRARSDRKALLKTSNLNAVIARRNELAPDLKSASISLVAELEYVDRILVQARQEFVSLRKQIAAAESGFSDLQGRISTLRDRYSAALQRSDTVIAEYEGLLAKRGDELLQRHYDNIEDFYLRSQLSLVNLYDDLAIDELEKMQADKMRTEREAEAQ
ncbi:hypothetical protein [Allohahella marinimesophila]|uniref:Tetratricopeptide repeat protein n=1 Tax=Allohahella marinimesophila TaxID=1054972 RepID=A0ABP7PER5_9GAMM